MEHLHPSCQAWTPPTPLASSQSAATTAHAATRRCSSSRKSRLSSSGATRRHLPTAPVRLCGEYPQPPTQPSSLASLSSPSLAYLPYLLLCLQGSPRTSYLQRVPMGGGALPWLFTCTSLLTALSLIAPKAPVSATRQKNRKEARSFRGCQKSALFWDVGQDAVGIPRLRGEAQGMARSCTLPTNTAPLSPKCGAAEGEEVLCGPEGELVPAVPAAERVTQ